MNVFTNLVFMKDIGLRENPSPDIAERIPSDPEMSQTKVELPTRPCSPAGNPAGSVTTSSAISSGQEDRGGSQSTFQDMYKKAFRSGDMIELEEILHRWADCVNVNIFDREGQTALHLCCLDGNLELVKLLVRSGANIHLSNRDGWSALHIAAFGGHQDIALYLIANSNSKR